MMSFGYCYHLYIDLITMLKLLLLFGLKHAIKFASDDSGRLRDHALERILFDRHSDVIGGTPLPRRHLAEQWSSDRRITRIFWK